jgi:hypothetical protein
LNLPRQHSRDGYLKIKDATKRLIRRCGGLERASRLTRIGKSRLSDCQNTSDLDTFLPADVVADLESHVGEPIVTLTLAEFATDPAEPHRPLDRLHRIQQVIKEASEAAVEIGNGDSQAALKEIEEGIEALEGAARDIRTRMARPTLAKVRAAE